MRKRLQKQDRGSASFWQKLTICFWSPQFPLSKQMPVKYGTCHIIIVSCWPVLTGFAQCSLTWHNMAHHSGVLPWGDVAALLHEGPE